MSQCDFVSKKISRDCIEKPRFQTIIEGSILAEIAPISRGDRA